MKYLSIFIIFISLNIQAQLNTFDMPYQSPLLFNPAFTGLSDFGRVKLFINQFI